MLNRERIQGEQDVLRQAVAIWRKAQLLHEDPSRQGEPLARACAEEIASAHPEYEQDLFALLQDDNQLVAAYALLTLELMRSPRLVDLPEGLLGRRANVTLLSGSIKSSTDLGGLARQTQKRARERCFSTPAGVRRQVDRTLPG
jgi:hypothetical protein